MGTVGLFVTCLADAMRPQIGVAAYRLLQACGAEVVYPAGQTCCGQIAFNSGYDAQAKSLAFKCAREFAHCDWVVVPSGSCCGMLRTHLTELSDSDEICQFSRKCLELSEFLERVNYTAPRRQHRRVTFHDSCAGLRELKIKNTPRRLLRDSGVEIVEMNACEECCGFGGRFAQQFGELSTAMGEKKCEHIIAAADESDIGAVVAGDLGCILHIEGILRRRRSLLPVLHWAEVLTGDKDLSL